MNSNESYDLIKKKYRLYKNTYKAVGSDSLTAFSWGMLQFWADLKYVRTQNEQAFIVVFTRFVSSKLDKPCINNYSHNNNDLNFLNTSSVEKFFRV